MDEHAPALAADDLLAEEFDFVNLTEADTGCAGTICVSTAMGGHGPRVKWYPGCPTRDGPVLIVTISATPHVVAHGLSAAERRRGEDAVTRWVALNQSALLDFWHNGVLWTRQEVAAFADRLAKIG